ncbi:3'-to-5' exoribonuclease RNase R [hydrothermal vent metagenome]|uniref:exoribonuclease II n=1 Tax=hydrothermal vent metagenome TaxID=652676 RepID=A0A3B0SGX4_9ZZZZ
MTSKAKAPFPTKDDILAYVKDNPGKLSKRDISKAFHIRGDQRVLLKKLLREMTADGLLDKGHKGRIHAGGDLPPVCVIEVTGLDKMGDLMARPVNLKEVKTPPPITIFAEDKRGNLAVHDQALVRLSRDKDRKEVAYVARVIRKLERATSLVMGVFRAEDDNIAHVQPTDKKNRNSYLIAKSDWNGAKDGELVLVDAKISKSSRRHMGPKRAIVKECLGTLDEPKSISLIAIHAHGILTEFSPQALEEAENSIPPILGDRTDLRAYPLITVDPADARDHDDAIWAEKDTDPKNEGGWHVIIAIADVAHYVTPGSGLEKDARERGNSTYFPDRVVPMLPESLSNGLCSLKEGEDRYCLAVHIWFDERGKKIRHKYVRGLMRSAAGLSYDEFQSAHDGQVSDRAAPLMDSVIEPLYAAYACLKKGRDYREPLDLVMPERKIELDDKGNVTGIHPRQALEAHKLVEEFMIQANVAAAEELEIKGWPCIYRVHEQPGEEKLNALREFLASLGYSFAKGMVQKPKLFNNILRKVKDSPHSEVINIIILRTQSQAIYSTDNLGHFGLSLGRYAHFTSPIRRFADLMVHRALIGALRLGKDGLAKQDREKLVETADHISKTERISMIAERESTDRYVAAYMGQHVGEQFDARIAGVSRAGLFVAFEETGGDGFIPVSSMTGDYFRHDKDLHLLEGEYTGIIYQLGDKVTVRLKEANRMTGGLLCELIDENLLAKSGPKKSRVRKPHRGRGGHKNSRRQKR